MRRTRRMGIVAALCLPGALIAAAAPAASAATGAPVKPTVHIRSNFSNGPASTSCQYYINAPNVHIRYEPNSTYQALTHEGDLFWSSPYTSSGVVAGQRWIRGTDLYTQRTGWAGRDYLTLQLCT
jgi:hypothetical protein